MELILRQRQFHSPTCERHIRSSWSLLHHLQDTISHCSQKKRSSHHSAGTIVISCLHGELRVGIASTISLRLRKRDLVRHWRFTRSEPRGDNHKVHLLHHKDGIPLTRPAAICDRNSNLISQVRIGMRRSLISHSTRCDVASAKAETHEG
jgi:hypothetical protein